MHWLDVVDSWVKDPAHSIPVHISTAYDKSTGAIAGLSTS